MFCVRYSLILYFIWRIRTADKNAKLTNVSVVRKWPVCVRATMFRWLQILKYLPGKRLVWLFNSLYDCSITFVTAVYWFGYEYLKAVQMSRAGNIDSRPTMPQCFIAGAASGTVSVSLATWSTVVYAVCVLVSTHLCMWRYDRVKDYEENYIYLAICLVCCSINNAIWRHQDASTNRVRKNRIL